MTRKYDVYAIGNALVDIVTEVEDDFLAQNGIEKGFMTLVDEERQHQLVKAIHLPDTNMQCGGSAANTIIGLSQFGGKGFYSCKVAKDEMGKFYLDDLAKNNVSTNLSYDSASEGITGKCLVMTSPDAERTMNTFLGITANFSIEEVNEEAIKNAAYLYIEGYLVTSQNGLEAMKYAKKLAEENGVKTSLTFSDPSMVKYFKSQMTEVVGSGVDLLFCNEEEATLFTGTENVQAASESLKAIAKSFVITQGADGALSYHDGQFFNIPSFPTQAIDANGAGDMFAGAFLYGISNGFSYEQAGKLASLAAAKVVSKSGPRLELSQAQKLLSEYKQLEKIS